MTEDQQLDTTYGKIKDELRKVHAEVFGSDKTLHFVDQSGATPPYAAIKRESPRFDNICSVTRYPDRIALVAEGLAGEELELRLREGHLKGGMPWWVTHYEKPEQSAGHTHVSEDVQELLQKVRDALLTATGD